MLSSRHTLTLIFAALALMGSPYYALARENSPIIPTNSAAVRVDKLNVSGGGELFTFYRTVSDPLHDTAPVEVPFVSVLRDTMGDSDPENDQLRDVWALAYTRPSIWKRALAGIPFLYHRGRSKPSSLGAPDPLLDMARPARGTMSRAGVAFAQSVFFDPLGVAYRATTRAYRSRWGEYRNMHRWCALEVLAAEHAGQSDLTDSELNLVRGRILLSRNVLGGFVGERYASEAWNKFEMTSSEQRAHNWDLLRQRAEDNGLYFQPVEFARGTPSFAMLWVEQASNGTFNRRFDSKFLGISDPFRDKRITEWNGYTEQWRFDAFGSPAAPAEKAAKESRMVPLALYSLEHPKVPLMLVDFRDAGKPRRREMMKRAVDDVTTGVLGWTGFGNLTWLAVRTSFNFVHSRRVSPLNRDFRVRAYVQVRRALTADNDMNPELRRVLADRLNKLGLNPFDTVSLAEQDIARRQYARLVETAQDQTLAAHLAKGRVREAERMLHSRGRRALFQLGAIASLGLYRHNEAQTKALLAMVDRQRRIAWHQRRLEQVLAAGPRPEIVTDIESVRESVAALVSLSAPVPALRYSASRLVSAVLAATGDALTQAVCRIGLERLSPGSTTLAHSAAQAVTSSSGATQ